MQTLKQLRKAQRMTQSDLAAKLGISRSSIAMWETGQAVPSIHHLRQLAAIFNVSTDALLGIGPSIKATSNSDGKIPILGKIVAGIPHDAIEEVIGFEEIDPKVAAKGAYFALKIEGDSMEPKMSNGDTIIIQYGSRIENGDIAVVLIANEESTVKRIKRTSDGLELIPLNPAYPVLHYTNQQVEQLPITILGKAIELRAKL